MFDGANKRRMENACALVEGNLIRQVPTSAIASSSPLGVIKEGASADILLVDGNPLDDASILCDAGNDRAPRPE